MECQACNYWTHFTLLVIQLIFICLLFVVEENQGGIFKQLSIQVDIITTQGESQQQVNELSEGHPQEQS